MNANLYESMKANLDSFTAYLNTPKFKFDIIGLTETWLHKDNSDLYNAPGYSHISLPREYSKGSGVSILLHSRLSYKRKDDLCMSNNTIECLFVEAFIVKKVLIGIIYRRPDTPISMLNEHLKNVIDSIKCSNIPCYLFGDFNINLLNQSSHQATSDLDILYSGGFIPLISRPTRIAENSATLIDHIYISTITM